MLTPAARRRARLEALLPNANVQAFFAVLRAGEGTADEDGYRRHFGGELFASFADHPRRAITKRLGGRPITSTAAGAFQFLARTWDECRAALELPDFSPASQNVAALFLIERRRALDDVLAGRIEAAIAKCAREWASLPGSPYGQPTKTLEQALETYRAAGGVERPADVPAPVETLTPTPTQENPMSPFLLPALEAIVPLVPALGRIFSSGSKVAERNVRAAEVIVDAAKGAIGARNEQELVEAVKVDPQAAQAVREAVQAKWYEITEAGGGGIDGARKADAAFLASGVAAWRSPAFLISLILLALPFMLLVDVLFVHPEGYTGELRTQIVTAVLVVIGMVGGYWIGSSFGSQRKDDALLGR